MKRKERQVIGKMQGKDNAKVKRKGGETIPKVFSRDFFLLFVTSTHTQNCRDNNTNVLVSVPILTLFIENINLGEY